MRITELVERFSREIQVLAGRSRLDAPIRWVHATDLADPAPYLKGGELILTNGQWRRRASDSAAFVESLAGAGAVAIGYGLRRPGASTPPDLISACEEAGMPLLQIPHDMAFVTISEEVATAHARTRERGLVGRLRRDEALLRTVSRGEGIDEVLRILARDYRVDLLLIDPAGQTIGAGTPSAHSLEIARLAIAEEVTAPAGRSVEGVDVTVFPVRTGGAVEALLVCFRAIDRMTEDEREAIGHELVFLGLELSRALMSREFNERLADELLELVGAGEARTVELAARLRSFQLDPGQPLVAIALVVEPADDVTLTRRVARLAARTLAAARVPAVVPVDGSVAIALASTADGVQVASHLMESFVREGLTVSAGVGSVAETGAQGLRRSVAEARLAADYAHLRAESGGVATYAEAGSYRVLMAAQTADSRAAFARAVLGPILDQDRERGSDLVETLGVFLRDGGHWQRVAEQLHLHVNTLRYRIGRVEQLTGRSLSSFEERVNLFIALEALHSDGGLEDPPT
jgi:sugar diacid utilization regulator